MHEATENTAASETVKKVGWGRWTLRIILLAVAAAGLTAGGYWFYLRMICNNFHVVVEGQVYRSAQPSPELLRKWADEYGLKTVINLRGTSKRDFYAPERKTAEELGLTMVDIKLSAVSLPTQPNVRKLITTLETAERPILIHCKDGADRSGVAGVIAAMAIGGRSYDDAREQLSWKYLHVHSSPDNIAGLLIRYEAWCKDKGVGTGGWEQFRGWATNTYHVAYYKVEIIAPERLVAKPGQTVIARLKITNISGETIPSGDSEKLFTVAVFSGSSEGETPDREFAVRTPLEKKDIPHGGSVEIAQSVTAPAEVGEYRIHFDLIEEHISWFARHGSPVPTCKLIVKE